MGENLYYLHIEIGLQFFKIDFITTQQNYVMKVIITVTENNDHKIFISKIFKHFVNNLAQF